MDGTSHCFLVVVVEQRAGEITGSYQLALEDDPDPSDRGGIAVEERTNRAVLRAKIMGLVSVGIGHGGSPLTDQGLVNLPAPKGLTIQDGNQFSDREPRLAGTVKRGRDGRFQSPGTHTNKGRFGHNPSPPARSIISVCTALGDLGDIG